MSLLSVGVLQQSSRSSYPLVVDAQALGDVEGLVGHLAVLYLDQLIVHCAVLEAFYPEAVGITRLDIVVRCHDKVHVPACQHLEQGRHQGGALGGVGSACGLVN